MQNINDYKYCVAIRTLGLAGNKFQQELDSIKQQTIPPQKILVYIAEGYKIPKETIGIEEYIYVPKGMIAQRALPYNEVDTEFILLLDDDVLLEPDFVEKLIKGIIENNGDCIAADVFKNQDMSVLSKLKAFATNLVYAHNDDNWAFKIHKNASFSYNSRPTKDVYRSQSAAGAASLWRTNVFRKIKFQDELWLDEYQFAYGEDLLLFYKMYVNGYNLLVHYDSGITHLDAQSSKEKYNNNPKKLFNRAKIWLLLWFRICYSTCTSNMQRLKAIIAFSMKWIWGLLVHCLFSIYRFNYRPIVYYIQGSYQGLKTFKSIEFQNLPNYIIQKK